MDVVILENRFSRGKQQEVDSERQERPDHGKELSQVRVWLSMLMPDL